MVVKGSSGVVSVAIVERMSKKKSNTHRFSFYTADCICSGREKHWEFILTAGVATYTADCTCKTIGMFPKTYTPSFTHTYRCSVIRGFAGFAGHCAVPFRWMVSVLVCVCIYVCVSV